MARSKTQRDPAPDINSDGSSEIARRLVVELTTRAAQDLRWLVDAEEMNKTTIVNRAIQVYKRIIEAQRNDQRLMIGNPDGTKAEILYVV